MLTPSRRAEAAEPMEGETMTMKWEYLGEDIYAEFDGEYLTLRTGDSPEDSVVLGLEPYVSLVAWMTEQIMELARTIEAEGGDA